MLTELREVLSKSWGAIALGLLAMATPVAAEDVFDNGGIEFVTDTTVEFEFKRTQGANQSTFGIVNLDTGEEVVLFQEVKPYDAFVPGRPLVLAEVNDFIGTVSGGTVVNGLDRTNPLVEFTFRANERYAFFLDSETPTGEVLRTLRSDSEFATLFDGSLDGGQQGDRIGTRIAWDDTGLPTEGKDRDFDDFVVEAGGYLVALPCPPVR